jgi:hypothetical protein
MLCQRHRVGPARSTTKTHDAGASGWNGALRASFLSSPHLPGEPGPFGTGVMWAGGGAGRDARW